WKRGNRLAGAWGGYTGLRGGGAARLRTGGRGGCPDRQGAGAETPLMLRLGPTQNGTCQQAHPGSETLGRGHYGGATGLRRMAGGCRKEDRGAHTRCQVGADAAGGGSGRSHLAAAVIRADPRYSKES